MELNLPKKRLFKNNARLWKRLVAFILDLFVVQVVIFFPFQRLFKSFQKASWQETFSVVEKMAVPDSVYWALFFVTALSILYFALFEYYLRQTIGMTILGIFVDGQLSFAKTLLRNIFVIPAFPFYILWIIEPLHLLFYRTRLLERFTHTNTVEVLEAY